MYHLIPVPSSLLFLIFLIFYSLGGAYTVFPAASHNRFEHCLGVAHLARRFVTHLATVQPELQITPSDALCIEIAGLIHDLGHGILSHLFDAKFIPAIIPDCEWEHEHASCDMFDYLIKRNHLLPYFIQAGLLPDDIHFIKELVYGSPKDAPKDWVWKGRGDKTFLYEIIANKRNGIDVDKWDYFQRDCRQLNMSIPFDAQRLMKFARVLRGFDNLLQIAYPVKEAWHVYQMFQARYSLHKRAYQHKVARVIESMYMEALIAADPYITVPAGEGVRNPDGSVTVPRLRMSQAIYNMGAYSRLSDYLLRTIACSVQPDLAKARHIIHRILQRDIYNWVGETILPAYEVIPEGTGLGNSFHSGSSISSSSSSSGAVGIVPIHSPTSGHEGHSSTIPSILIGADGFPHRLSSSSSSPNAIAIAEYSYAGGDSTTSTTAPVLITSSSGLASTLSTTGMNSKTNESTKPAITNSTTTTTNTNTTSSSTAFKAPPTVTRLQAVDGKLVFGKIGMSTHKKSTKVPRLENEQNNSNNQTGEDDDNDIGIPLSQIAVLPTTRTNPLSVTPPLDIQDIASKPTTNTSSNPSNSISLTYNQPPIRRFKARRALKEADRLEITDILVDIAKNLSNQEIEDAWLRYGYVHTPRQQYKRLLNKLDLSTTSTTTPTHQQHNIPKFNLSTHNEEESTPYQDHHNDTSSIISHSDDENNDNTNILLTNDIHSNPDAPADEIMNTWLTYAKNQFTNTNTIDNEGNTGSSSDNIDILNMDAEKFRVATPHMKDSHGNTTTTAMTSPNVDWNIWNTQGTQNTTVHSVPYQETMQADDILVDIVTINYGMGSKDPVEKVLFYEVDKRTGELTPTKVKPNQVSVFVPSTFEEQYVRLYVKRKSIRHLATAAFDRWCQRARTSSPTVFSPARKPKRKRFDEEIEGKEEK